MLFHILDRWQAERVSCASHALSHPFLADPRFLHAQTTRSSPCACDQPARRGCDRRRAAGRAASNTRLAWHPHLRRRARQCAAHIRNAAPRAGPGDDRRHRSVSDPRSPSHQAERCARDSSRLDGAAVRSFGKRHADHRGQDRGAARASRRASSSAARANACTRAMRSSSRRRPRTGTASIGSKGLTVLEVRFATPAGAMP